MTKRRSIGIGLLAAGILALAAGLAWRQLGEDGVFPATRRDGSTLMSLAFPDADGRPQSLNQWNGKVLVVNFWATWCEPCREEMPRFIKLQDRYGKEGLQFVGIAIDQADKVKQFASDIHLNYPALLGGYGAIELSKTLGNQYGALPFTVIVNRTGSIVYTKLGPVEDRQLESILAKLS